MKRRTQIKLKQLRTIVGVWLVIGLMISFYDYLLLNSQYALGPSADYSYVFSLAMNLGSALIGALIGGSFMVFFINVRYQDKPYGYTVLAVSISFLLIIALIIFLLAWITVPLKTGKPLFDPGSKAVLYRFLFDTSRIKNTLIWSVVVALTQLSLQINNKFGHGVFWNIIRGKYHTPKEENRIFMSVDLNSSTSIAEKLGDEKYHELLKDLYSDITNPILDNNAEIYQYVGDEVIIAWKRDEGIENNRCIKCFFDIKLELAKKKDKYLSRYGLIPSFKAGIHWGKVVVGEIGIIKRDITYSGNVMNTISRIQTMCRDYDAEVIASADLLDMLSLPQNYVTKSLGSFKLRGKEKEVLLSSLILVI